MCITYIPIENLRPHYENDTPPELEEKAREEILSSVKKNGILLPFFVRKDNNSKDQKDKYLIYSGHKYYHAALELGIEELPCIIIANEWADDMNRMDFIFQDLVVILNDTLRCYGQNNGELKIGTYLIWKMKKYFSKLRPPTD